MAAPVRCLVACPREAHVSHTGVDTSSACSLLLPRTLKHHDTQRTGETDSSSFRAEKPKRRAASRGQFLLSDCVFYMVFPQDGQLLSVSNPVLTCPPGDCSP
jgi:hypothetical protein